MNTDAVSLLKLFFGLISSGLVIVAAWFEFQNRAQTKQDRDRTRDFYGQKWMAINNTGVLDLPEKAVVWGLGAIERAMERVMGLLLNIPMKTSAIIYAATPILLGIGTWVQSGWRIVLVLTVPVVSSVINFYFFKLRKSSAILILIASVAMMVTGGLCWAIEVILCLKLTLGAQIVYSALVLTLLLPVTGFMVIFPLMLVSIIANPYGNNFFNYKFFTIFGTTIAMSFSVTLIALLIGHFADPSSWIPQTLQMLLSNVFFDGLTVLATIKILSLTLRRSTLHVPILVAIFFDVLVAALLACASLYCGLMLTDKALTVSEVLYVLIGMLPETGEMDIGPYFWAMHTTFLPTLFYLALILICWIGKLVVFPVAKVLRRGEVVDKPHHLTAGAFLLVATIFGAALATINNIEENVTKEKVEQVIPADMDKSCS
jgi:hypothetical protein